MSISKIFYKIFEWRVKKKNFPRLLFAVCRYGSGWTWSRILSLCSTSTSRTSSTRACRWWRRPSWEAARWMNRNWARTRRPTSSSTPRTFPSTRNGSNGKRSYLLRNNNNIEFKVYFCGEGCHCELSLALKFFKINFNRYFTFITMT